jgi:hypothetical protein
MEVSSSLSGVDGHMRITQMGFWHHDGTLRGPEHMSAPGEHYSVAGYEPGAGLLGAIYE